jgi:serine/threonine protein kinase
VVEGAATVDGRADLYSSGVIFHEMLTGRAPGPKFALPTQIDPRLSPEIDVVVLRCLSRRPAERYATAEDLLAAVERLEEILRLRTLTEIREASSLILGSEKGKRPVALYVIVAILALAALAAAGYWLAR